MKMTNETKVKVQYSIAIGAQVMKLTLQILVAIPAFHYGYMGFSSMGWVSYTVTATNFYEAAGYLLALVWLEILVLGIGMIAITVRTLTKGR